MIIFFGPDGSGKTTLARILAKYLLSKGVKIEYIRLKSHHLTMYLLIRLLYKIGVIQSMSSPRILDFTLKKYFGNSKLFIYLELVNVVTWLIINLKIKQLFRKKIIVADRFIPDFLVSMLFMYPNPKILKILYRILEYFMRDSVKIFLYSNIIEALNRKKEELLSYNYMKNLLHLYVEVVSLIGVDLIINTSKHSVYESFELIRDYLRSRQVIKESPRPNH